MECLRKRKVDTWSLQNYYEAMRLEVDTYDHPVTYSYIILG
jgi:hypothetical protein